MRLGLTFISVSSIDIFTLIIALTPAYRFFFGHLTPAVEDLRYQHAYHPVPVEEKSPALASVLDEVGAGRFGDGSVYEPCV